MTTVGFVGTGGMGGPMATNLVGAGFPVVVHDLDPARTRRLEEAGAKVAGSPRAVAEAADVVLSMLPDGDAVRSVALGDAGLLSAAGGARTWIDFSSVDRATILEVSVRLTDADWSVIDCTVSGVEEAAAAATLSIWVGCLPEQFEPYRDIFSAVGHKVVRVGDLGAAKVVKNAIAMYAAITTLSLAELSTWLGAAGVEADMFQTVLRSSPWHGDGVDRVMAGLVSKEFKARPSWMPKDVAFGLDVARELEIAMPFAATAAQLFAIAQANGHGGYEATGMAHFAYETMSGGPV